MPVPTYEDTFSKLTNFLFNPDYIDEVYQSYQERLDGKTLLEVSPPIIAARLRKNKMLYLEYGPYWWALKQILNEQGFNFGDETDEMLADRYCMKDAKGEMDRELTLVACDEFANDYRENYYVGNYRFELNAEGDTDYLYMLFDEDMQKRVPKV